MPVHFLYEGDKPRTVKELKEALVATQNEFVTGKISPMSIHYVVIIDALKELIELREGDN